MKQTLPLICLFVFFDLLSGFGVFAQSAKVVGYLPTYRFALSSQIEYCKLTHLNLAFANPDASGNIIMPDISTIMTDAKAGNPDMIICISLAGGALSAQQASNWSTLIDIPANRPAFIAKIVAYVLDNNLDGVDVDLEWSHVTSGYSGFVTELDAALTPHNKILTVAFPQTLFTEVNAAALAAFDFINIMSYDAKGPWNPADPGPHSPYSFSVNGVNFWKNTVGIAGERLTLGVPFYGYDFVNATTANSFTYGSMVATNVNYSELDQVGNSYYNGRPTITSKVNLANKEVSGTMIWELGQDSFDEYSLLTTIHDTYTSLGITTSGLCGNELALSVDPAELKKRYVVYPNPSQGRFFLKYEDFLPPRVLVKNNLGQTIQVQATQSSLNELRMDLSAFPKGFYFIQVINSDKELLTYKLLLE